MQSKSIRDMSNILERANDIVNNKTEEKERMYGPFEKVMERMTAIYNAISPEDERMTVRGSYRAMVAMKLAREINHHKEDNLLDCVAYLGALDNYEQAEAKALEELLKQNPENEGGEPFPF